MASLPDVVLQPNHRIELYTATGLLVGTAILVQNKSKAPIQLFESASEPGANSRDGRLVEHGEEVVVLAGSPGVWVLCRRTGGRVFVQVLPL